MIRVLVVDDEAPAQSELSYIINQHPDFKVVGTASSGREALAQLRVINPQVAFLDIKLYDLNGLELAEMISAVSSDILIVFATAYDEFAVKAFELNALDYVVKPFDEVRVFRTLNRLCSLLNHKQKSQFPGLGIPEEHLVKLCAKKNDRLSVFNCKDIIYITAHERKTVIKLHHDSLSSFYTLKELSERLNPQDFIRVHRAFLVNLHYIKEIIPWFSGSYTLVMADQQGSEIPVSRTYVKELKHRLGVKTFD